MIALRRATPADAGYLLALRQDVVTRANSRSTEPIDPEAHAAWLGQLFSDDTRRLYVAEHWGQAVGVGRLDVTARGTEISITIAPAHRGRGLAARMIEALVKAAPAAPVIAVVRTTNRASIIAFLHAGFTPCAIDADLAEEAWPRWIELRRPAEPDREP